MTLSFADPYQASEESLPIHLVQSPVHAAALLDGMSLLELYGARWILAVTPRNWTDELHEHCADEVRHSILVQDTARALRWELSAEDSRREVSLNRAVQEATRAYLDSLSKRVFLLTRRALGAAWTVPAYVVLAFLIERRLMKVYPHLAKHGATEEARAAARELIQDERKHLSFVNGKLPETLEASGVDKNELVSMEEELFSLWTSRVCHAYPVQ